MPDRVPRQLRLAELHGALSHALDITEGQPRGHCVRCCWIGIHVGRRADLGDVQPNFFFSSLMLKAHPSRQRMLCTGLDKTCFDALKKATEHMDQHKAA